MPPPSLQSPAPVIAPGGPPWVNLVTHPEAIRQIGFVVGSPIEVTLENPPGVVAATAIFLVQAIFPLDDQGILLEVFFCGASCSAADAALPGIFPRLGQEGDVPHGLLHICSETCTNDLVISRRPVLQVDCFRHRQVHMIKF